MNRLGRYFVIEGQDATGKSTQIELIADHFRELGQEVVTYNESGCELPPTHEVRTTILSLEHDLDPVTNVLLYTAIRRELWKKKAEPMLARGALVLAARNWWSTLAYQGYGQGVDLDLVIETTRRYLPPEYTRPDFGVMLILDDMTRRERMYGRDANHKQDTFESKGDDFQQRVNRGYEQIAQDFGIPIVDASPEPQEIARTILSIIE